MVQSDDGKLAASRVMASMSVAYPKMEDPISLVPQPETITETPEPAFIPKGSEIRYAQEIVPLIDACVCFQSG